jgi:nitroreductase/NAD-dependent dihydropyrimidine dehydrogenase PreA subunit
MVQNYFDLKKCTACGICYGICPIGIIEKDAQSGFPFVSERNMAVCIKCGHCEAACPENVIAINHPSLQNVSSVKADGAISSDQLRVYCLRRRSVRKYRQEVVGKEVITALFDIVRYAPTGVNRQPVKWLVVHNPDVVKQLSDATMAWIETAVEQRLPLAVHMNFHRLVQSWKEGSDPICRSAPHLAIAYVPKNDRIAAGDATIALAHLELGAPAFGLGACWAGYFTIVASQSEKVKELLALPVDHVVLGTMMLGYPQTKYFRIPKRNFAAITWK